MDIAALVRAVNAAFQDASKLVGRIRDQREKAGTPLSEEPTRDLLESLALGPTIVKGQFDYEHRRWTEQYAVGDIQAREQMKDVLIALQMTLISTLRMVYMDDLELDFDALQTASDDCRVNAGVCLGQLSQRLSDHAKAQAMYPQNIMAGYGNGTGLMPPMSPGLAHSSSQSTQSSGFGGPRTPQDRFNEHFATLSVSTDTIKPPIPERKRTTSSQGSQGYGRRPMTPKSHPDSFGGVTSIGIHRVDEDDGTSLRRPSSHTLAPEDSELLSPAAQSPPADAFGGHLPGTENIDPASNISGAQSEGNSSAEISRNPSTQQVPQIEQSRDRFGPEDYTPVVAPGEFSHGNIYDMYRSTSGSSGSASYSARAHEQNHSTLEHIRYLQQNSRPPRYGSTTVPVQMPEPLQSPQVSHFPQPPNFRPRQDSMNSGKRSTPRKPVPPANNTIEPPYPSTTPPPAPRNARPLVSAATPVEHPPASPAAVMPQRAPTGTISHSNHPINNNIISQYRPTPLQSSAPPATTNSSVTSLPVGPPTRTTTNLSIASNTPLNLPAEKATQGFCKAAVRLFLQNGVPSKAFAPANRPMGYSGMVPYWRCEKCNFEGPVATQVNTSDIKKKKGKEEKIFDPKVRVSLGGGVRYKWAFLARSHCALKSQVDYNSRSAREGEVGAFQCLFCCAEGVARGWTTGGNMNGNASIRSGSTGSGAGQTPVFGNLQLFLEHLDQTHRAEVGWPSAEMLGRMKCVVGRIAAGDEDWVVNLVPLE